MAGTSDTGTVTVTVMEEDVPVTDETVTLSLSPVVGMVTSPATNNGDGTYSATYTSGGHRWACHAQGNGNPSGWVRDSDL